MAVVELLLQTVPKIRTAQDARRWIKQGAVFLDGVQVLDPKLEVRQARELRLTGANGGVFALSNVLSARAS